MQPTACPLLLHRQGPMSFGRARGATRRSRRVVSSASSSVSPRRPVHLPFHAPLPLAPPSIRRNFTSLSLSLLSALVSIQPPPSLPRWCSPAHSSCRSRFSPCSGRSRRAGQPALQARMERRLPGGTRRRVSRHVRPLPSSKPAAGRARAATDKPTLSLSLGSPASSRPRSTTIPSVVRPGAQFEKLYRQCDSKFRMFEISNSINYVCEVSLSWHAVAQTTRLLTVDSLPTCHSFSQTRLVRTFAAAPPHPSRFSRLVGPARQAHCQTPTQPCPTSS